MTTDHRRIDIGRFAEAVRTRADGEAFRRIAAGDPVPLRIEDPIELLVSVLAVDAHDGVPLVCDSRWGPEHTAAVISSLSLQNQLKPGVAVFTSGSTGRPRAIMRSRASWVDSFEPLTQAIGLTADDAVLLPVPLVSSLSMFAAMHALAAGCGVLIPSTASGAGLSALLADATVVHTTPTSFLRILDLIEHGAPSRLRLAVIGGAALAGNERERAWRLGIRAACYYGAAELSFVAIDTDGAGLRPFADVELRAESAGGDIGRLWARSPYLSDGYLGEENGSFERDVDGWATVGDLVTTSSGPGQGICMPLELRGRGDGAILTAGATVVPEDVEALLRSLPGITDAVVFGAPHPALGAIVCVVVETTNAAGAAERARWQSACRESLTAAQLPRLWYAVPELPRTVSGKPARAVVIEAALNEGPRADISSLGPEHVTTGVRRLG